MIKISLKSRSYLQLLVTLLALLVIMPFIEVGEKILDNIIVSTFFLLLLVSSLKAIMTKGIGPRKNYIKWVIGGVALIAFLSDILEAILQVIIRNKWSIAFSDRWINVLNIISLFSYSFLIFLLIIFIIRDLFSGQKIKADKIYGAAASYLLMGVMWACLYSAIIFINPDSVIKANGAALTRYSEIQYFSFTTLCTLGYGDIIPNCMITMVLSNLEVITGSLYLAILVARLVGLYTAQSSHDQFLAALRTISAKTGVEFHLQEKNDNNNGTDPESKNTD